MAYTVEGIQEIVSLNFGAGAQVVELLSEHYKRGLDSALKLLERHRPMHGYIMVPVTHGGQKYRVDARNLTGVLDVSFFNSGTRLEFAPYYTRWVDRNFERAEMKDCQRAFDDKPEWHFAFEYDSDAGQDVGWVYTSITESSFVDTFARVPNYANIQFAWGIEASNDPLVGVGRIPRDMRQWVEDYTTARCRLTLGDIRGKYGGIPGAVDGSTLRNDGADQVQRAEQRIRELEKDLMDRRRHAALILD